MIIEKISEKKWKHKSEQIVTPRKDAIVKINTAKTGQKGGIQYILHRYIDFFTHMIAIDKNAI